MAKSQKKSNKEIRKPKAVKTDKIVEANPFAKDRPARVGSPKG